MLYNINKKTPTGRWYTIHKNMELESAKNLLEVIAENYNNDPEKYSESRISEDGLFMTAYESRDLHEFRIVEA